LIFNLEMAHFDAYLRYSDVGLYILILKFCCMWNKVEYIDTRQRTKAEGAERVQSGEGLCQENYR